MEEGEKRRRGDMRLGGDGKVEKVSGKGVELMEESGGEERAASAEVGEVREKGEDRVEDTDQSGRSGAKRREGTRRG